MLKEKNEDRAEVVPQRTARPGRTLRERLAGLQCRWLCLRYRVKLAVNRRLRKLRRKVNTVPLFFDIGNNLYALGFFAEYQVVCAARGIKKAAGWLAAAVLAVAALLDRVLLGALRTMLDELFRPILVFFRGVYNLFVHVNGVRRSRGLPAAVWEALCYFGRGIRRYAWLVPRSLAYIVPACAALLFVTVVRGTLGREYTLAVQVNGETVGYVESEQVFDSAKNAVDERINYAGTSETSWEIEPTYSLAVATDVLNENQMADAILSASSDEIMEGTALYLDGELAAVTTEGDRLQRYLDSMKAPYEDPTDESLRVEFSRDVELVDGVFFTDSFSEYDDVQTSLTGLEQAQVNYTVVAGDSLSLIASKNGLTLRELYACNPGLTQDTALFPGDTLVVEKERQTLEVRIIKTVVRQEEIPFQTETTKSNEYSFGTTKTVQEGVKGLKDVTEEITYDTEGNVLSTVLVRETVLSEPVTRKIVQGTKLPDGQVGQYGSGTFQWPVPTYRYVSRWYGKNGHKGVDICAPAYTPIIAADSGVVTAAGWNAAGSGYGYCVIINHGNGYQTLYAHCIELYVSAGQSVTKGQTIAGMGSTGRSTGNHLHWEIRYNGVKMPPQNWFPNLVQ